MRREREALPVRSDYPWTFRMPTRWADNDRYGHVNNAVYYGMFENAIMHWLESECGLDPNGGDVRCFTVENGCRYLDALRHPDEIDCGLRVARIGNSSVRYELGLFATNRDPVAATGFVVDVFVDSVTERPIPVPVAFREALAPLMTGTA